MYYKTQLQKYAIEWIENEPSGSKFHVSHVQDYLATNFPLECIAAGRVPSGETHYLNDARQAVRKCRSTLNKCRKGRWKRGWWQKN